MGVGGWVGVERHTKPHTKTLMKYKIGEAEFKVNFILEQISSSAQGWRTLALPYSADAGTWQAAIPLRGYFELLPWYKGICGDLKAYGIEWIQNTPQFQRASVFLWHTTASLHLRAGRACASACSVLEQERLHNIQAQHYGPHVEYNSWYLQGLKSFHSILNGRLWLIIHQNHG